MPHVAFVPLVGARVRHERVRALGMTLPDLRRRGAAIEALPALGLLTLAGLTPEDWSRSWHDDCHPCDALLERILAQRPTLVAISALTASIELAYGVADRLRERGARVVLGGLHVTALPDEAARHSDAVVVGEGEPVWLDLLRDAERGALRPRYQASCPFDLAAAPLPAYELLGGPRPRFTLQTQRGCPFACEFCAASRVLGPFREKPLARIEAELVAIAARDPRPRIELADDNTFAGRRDAPALLRALGGANARWFTESDWRLGERPEALDALADSGCAQVLVGVESLAPRHAGLGRKAAELPRVVAALEAIQARGVAVNGCFVVGADGETHESLAALQAFLLEAPFAELQVTLQTPFPGSPLHRRLAHEGRLLEGRGWDHYTLFDVTYRPDRMSPGELEQAFHALVAAVFAPGPSARRAAIRRELQRRRRGGEP